MYQPFDNLWIWYLFATCLTSIAMNAALKNYLLASALGSGIGAAVVLARLLPHLKFSWIFICFTLVVTATTPLSFLIGLPFLLDSRLIELRRRQGRRSSIIVEAIRRLVLASALCILVLGSAVITRAAIDRTARDEMVYTAARDGTPSDIQEALDAGGDINYHPGYGTTPLMIASFYGRAANVAFLLSRGADPSAANCGGDTAMKWATQNKHHNVVALLRRAGAKD